jgi:putative effector of murein hydrolase
MPGMFFVYRLELQVFTTPRDVMLACYRRSLCYPLYRNWQLTERVWKDVLEILTVGNYQCRIIIFHVSRDGVI